MREIPFGSESWCNNPQNHCLQKNIIHNRQSWASPCTACARSSVWFSAAFRIKLQGLIIALACRVAFNCRSISQSIIFPSHTASDAGKLTLGWDLCEGALCEHSWAYAISHIQSTYWLLFAAFPSSEHEVPQHRDTRKTFKTHFFWVENGKTRKTFEMWSCMGH